MLKCLHEIGLRFKGVFVRLTIPLLTALLFCVPIRAHLAHGQSATITPPITDDLDRESLRVAIGRSMAYLAKLPPNRPVGEQPRRFTAKEISDGLAAFDKLLDRWDCWSCLVEEFNSRFELVPSSSDDERKEVLFTGYYQPVIDGSLVETAEHRYPLYAKPADLITVEQITSALTENVRPITGRIENGVVTPYYSRREIDELGSLHGRGLEIAWVKDPVDLFFLHIQGSGILRLTDGKQIHVGYAGQNGRPYRSIGRLLIDQGKIPAEEMSMQRLRRYLAEYPDERSEIMSHNESYVFFSINHEGPLGSLEVPVTAGRSMATDSRLFPKGALALIYTLDPVLGSAGQLLGWRPVVRFVLNQDTGGAIRGFQRADLYFGTGDESGARAGYMNSPGKIYFVSLRKQRDVLH
jgi:membrane-bound lytic murein transglycosylase A